ncbi:MAG: YggT family protein [Gemmatimonadaceae bacterium]|nr:YggT family protein [Gemmatimonadaceae bacterium]
MTAVLSAFATLRDLLQAALLWLAVAVAGIAVVDWMVRTRRLNPFGPVARFFRHRIDPWLEPVERRVVRFGGLPASAPWWALAAVVGGGILLLASVDFAASLAADLSRGLSDGPGGLLRLVVFWSFTLLRLAIIVSVVATWLPVSPFSPWVRWSFVLAEPILRPLRRIVPTFGGIDITPIIGFFGLSILESLVRGALA